MTLGFDARTISLSTATNNTFGHTVADNGNMGLFVFLHLANTVTRSATVTYDGVSMTQEVNAERAIGGGIIKATCFSLIDPSIGTNDVVVSWSGAVGKVVSVALSYSGAHQADIVDATNTNVGLSNNPFVVVTTNTDRSFVVGGYAFEGGDGDPATPGPDDNERWDIATGTSQTADMASAGGDTPKITAGAETISFTANAVDDWVMIGVELKAEPAPVRGLAIFF